MACFDASDTTALSRDTMGDPLSSEHGSGIKLSICTPEIEITPQRTVVDNFVFCTKNPGHVGMTEILKLKETDLPSGHQTTKNLYKVKQHAERTVRVEVEEVSQHRPQPSRGNNSGAEDCQLYGTGFLFPGGFYQDKACPCKECQESSSPHMEYHNAYVMTARHVVYDDFEARNVTFSLFYDRRYKHNVKTMHGLGLAGKEEVVCVDDKGCVAAVVVNEDGDEIDGGDGDHNINAGGEGMDSADPDPGCEGMDSADPDPGCDSDYLLDFAICAFRERGQSRREKMAELKIVLDEYLNRCYEASDTDHVEFGSCNNLGEFIKSMCEDLPGESLFIAQMLLKSIYMAGNINESIFETVQDIVGTPHMFETIPKHVDAILDQCKKVQALTNHFIKVKDENLYQEVGRLYLVVRLLCNSIIQVLVCVHYLTAGKVNRFMDSCIKLLQSLFEKVDSIKMSEADQSEKEEGVLWQVKRLSRAVLTFVKNDLFFFLNLLIPVFTNEKFKESPQPLAAIAHFCEFVHNDCSDVGNLFNHVRNALSCILDKLHRHCQTKETDSRFLAALHRENLSILCEKHSTEGTPVDDDDLIKYKTDRVLVKCATHDPHLIQMFKAMQFSPQCPPFTFIISHPHGYFKRIGFGRVTKMPVQGSHCLYVVKMGGRSRFRLSPNSQGSSPETEEFIKMIKHKTGIDIQISPGEELPLCCELTAVFPSAAIANYKVVESSSCWLKFPPGTVCVTDEENCDSIALPECLEFYSYFTPKDVLSSLKMEKPFCFTHNVPTCDGSSGALVSMSELMVGLWHTHCAICTENGETVGLTSIKPHGWMNKKRKKKMAVKEFLDIRPNAFVGPTPLTQYSGAPFQ